MVNKAQQITEEIEILEYQEKYQDQIYALVLSIFEIELKDVPSSGYLGDISKISTIYGGERNQFWIAKVADRVVGVIALKEDTDKEGLVRRLFVSPTHRSKGVATKLLNMAVSFAKEKKYKKLIFVGNSKMHKARRALVHYGFEEVEDIKLGDIEIFKLAYKI